ncbi:hypothetical protein J1605_022939 [Eschrichtius robustus]|uniref:Uncharacterized protein n=1 Tax=Eschrichtius robustus TaxID=9764 RepID=A0AB34HAF0_ESCRO|nr:hypothetical protein J1605_022939 [Eschrichtius robustus]
MLGYAFEQSEVAGRSWVGKQSHVQGSGLDVERKIRHCQAVDDCGFSLSHPNQFFFESQRILSGGKDVKKESVQPETPQPKPSVQRSKDVSSALASLNSSLEMDLEGLEELLQ